FWQPGQAAFHPVVQGHLRPGFPLCRVERDPGPEPPLGRWAGVMAEWRTLRDAADGPPDPMGAMVLADGLQLAAALQVEELQAALRVPGPPPPGPAATAEALFTESLWLFDEDCRAWSNFAALKGLLGQTEFALEAATRAAELCPLHGPARANHVRYLFLAGRMEEGLAAASDALALPVRGDLVPRLRRLVGDLDAGGRGDAARTLERLLPP
ncbi:MAG: hypothetical protein FJ098_15750, partial [Deltaproteobacteria bacterium]|nr:hypothetical protein [Deltaproteobacteria bacterium]